MMDQNIMWNSQRLHWNNKLKLAAFFTEGEGGP